MALLAGTRLGVYEIGSPLGAGGMGEVYRARDSRLDRTVAIKVLPENLAADPQFRERFDREARAISQLTHPHICTLYDVGQQDGMAFLVMEHLEGETLAERLTRGALPLDDAVKIAIEIADALTTAHRHGIVHRDLKPSNVMLTKGGAKLLDFGLAKGSQPIIAGAALSMLPTTPPHLTAQGTILGTLQYMAPEQLEGQETDARTDIFAFGAVVYEMLTGKKAFNGKSQASLISAIMSSDPLAIATSQPLTPPVLDWVVKKCLAKEPSERWQSAKDLHDELQWIADAGSQAGVPSRPLIDRHRQWSWAVAAATLAASAVMGWGWWRTTRRADRPFMRFSAELAQGPNRTLRLDDVILAVAQPGTSLALSPDGARLAVRVRDADGRVRLAARRLDESRFAPLLGTENATSPFFSPDGQWIGFFGDGQLRTIPVQGGASSVLCSTENFPSGSWGDDGTIIAALRTEGGLSRVPSGGGTPMPVTKLKNGEIRHRWPQVLPGSEAVLFTAYSGGGPEDANIDILSFKTHETKTLVHGGEMGRYVAAQADGGYLVYLRQNVLLAAPFDARNLAVTGVGRPVLDDVSGIIATTRDFDVSRTGTFVYLSGRGEPERSIFWLDQSGKTEPLHSATGFYNGLQFSPDGKRLVFGLGSDLGREDLWIQDLERNTSVRLTSLPGASHSPVWFPDGEHILFTASNQPKAGIYWIRADGGGEPKQLTQTQSVFPSSFSPDGRSLAFAEGNPFTGMEVSTAPFGGTSDHPHLDKPALFLRARGFPMPAFSPDGRWLAYASGETGTSEVYVQPFPDSGGKTPISSGGGSFPIWAPNGRELFFIDRDRRIRVADYTAESGSFSPGQPRLWSQHQILLKESGGPFQPYALAPDGKRFAVLLYSDGTTEHLSPLHLTFLLNFDNELGRRMRLNDK